MNLWHAADGLHLAVNFTSSSSDRREGSYARCDSVVVRLWRSL